MACSAIKTAVIGNGFSAQTFHIPFITSLKKFELTAISTSKQQQLQEDWPLIQHFDSAEALITSSDAELVIITAPNDVHFQLAKAALENGKHVIIEKPFVTKVEDGEVLIALAKEKGLMLSIYHNRRWDGDFLTVKKMIDEQRFGELKHFESHFDRFRPVVRERWKEQAADGGGILFDLGSHLLDQSITLFGLPDAITADCRVTRKGSNNVDYFHLLLHYSTHLVVLHGDMISAGENKRFTIKGTGGCYEKLGIDPQEQYLVSGVMPVNEDWSAESPSQYGNFYDEQGCIPVATVKGCYQEYYHQVAKAIRQGATSPVKAEDALLNIKLIELALESSRLGKKIQLKDTV